MVEVPITGGSAYTSRELMGGNDTGWSLSLRDVEAGVHVFLFDHPQGEATDDSLEITVSESVNYVCIASFEESRVFPWGKTKYRPKNGLNGDVSRVEFGFEAHDYVWLIVKGVELVLPLGESPRVKVTARVNGSEYVYPSLEGVEWMRVGPEMSAQRFRIPEAKSGYDVRFTMIVDDGNERVRMVSMNTNYIDQLPSSSGYSLYRVDDEATRGASVVAVVKYELTRDPN